MKAIPSQTHHWPAQQRVHPNARVEIELPRELERLQSKRVLVLSTNTLVGSDVLSRVQAAVGSRLSAVYGGISAHTPAEQVAEVAHAITDCNADLVVAVGGGSVIDGGKAACYAAWNRQFTRQAVLDGLPKGYAASDWDSELPSPRLLAVPTTLSAAEFSSHAGVTDTVAGRKHVVLHPHMAPKVVLLDPASTLETPAQLLLSSAIRALDHGVERWCSSHPSPFSDAVSLQAIRMLREALPMIHANPKDLTARSSAQVAAWLSVMGGWAGTPVGASHGLGYILGAFRGVPHGITSCLMLPAVLQWNAAICAERQSTLLEVFGPSSSAADGVREFIASMNLPTQLSQVGIHADDFETIAAQYDGTGPIATNPRPVAGIADLKDILQLAR